MTWRVEITRSAVADGVALQIVHQSGTVVQQLLLTQHAEVVEPGTAMPAPSLTVDDALGRALLDALADHYGNTSGGRQQRADFEHARARVDKLTDRVLDVLDLFAAASWDQQVPDDG